MLDNCYIVILLYGYMVKMAKILGIFNFRHFRHFSMVIWLYGYMVILRFVI